MEEIKKVEATENTSTSNPSEPNTPSKSFGGKPEFDKSKRRPRRGGKFQKKDDGFEEKVVAINRVVKTTKGGRAFRFAALVVVGDKKGRVGFGTAKAKEVPDAIKKAIKAAKTDIYKIKMVKAETIPHVQLGVYGAGRVLLKPAKSGTGIIAGGPVRAVMELAGIHNIYSKSLGSNTPINVIRATMEALKVQRTQEDIQALRFGNEISGGAK